MPAKASVTGERHEISPPVHVLFHFLWSPAVNCGLEAINGKFQK